MDKTHLVGEIVDLKARIEQILSSPDLKDLHQLNSVCKQADELIAEQIAVVKKEELDKLKQFYDTYKDDLFGYPELLEELETAYVSSEHNIENGQTITSIILVSNGFGRNGTQLLNRIVKPPVEPPQPGDSHPKKRGTFFASASSSKLSIDSEDDIEAFVDTLRTKMKEKLKDGPFDVKW